MTMRKYSTDDFGAGGRKFIKWDTEGMTIAGKWVRVQASQFKGNNGEIRDEAIVMVESEEKVMPLTKALLTFFESVFGGVRHVPEGAEFEITFTGTRKIKGQPSPMKIFDVAFEDAAYPQDEAGF